MEVEIPNGFYRVSMKALILDETRTKFAITREERGWELPGGGMDWGETPETCLRREIQEEMGLEVTYVAPLPSYYLIGKNMNGKWTLNLLFETRVRDLDFTQSEECQELRFVSSDDAPLLNNAFRTVIELAEQFRPEMHK